MVATAESNDSAQEWRKVTFGSTGRMPLSARGAHNERTMVDAIAMPLNQRQPTTIPKASLSAEHW